MSVTLKATSPGGRTFTATAPDRASAAHALAAKIEAAGYLCDRSTLRVTGAVFRGRAGRAFTRFSEDGKPEFAPGGPARRYDAADARPYAPGPDIDDPDRPRADGMLDRPDLTQLAGELGYDTGVLDGLDETQLAEVIRVCAHWRDEAKKGKPPESDEAADLEAAEQFCSRFSEDLGRCGVTRADIVNAVRTATPAQRRELAADYRRRLAR